MGFEYAFVWVGQENGRPWGSKVEGFTQCPDLNLASPGIDLTNIVIASGEETGNGKTLSVDTVLVPGKWAGAQLRLGTVGVPLGGYATVTANTATTITVNWNVAAASDGTFQGYLVRPDFTLYPNVRVLVPYQPEGDGSTSVAYPAGAPVLPPGYTLPAAITSNEDWGLFLPFTFKEGIAGHGISNATDSYSSPQTHAASAADATSLTWVNGTGDTVVVNSLAGGYVRVTSGASLENHSWGRIASNTATTITLDAAGWLGVDPPAGGTASTWIWEAWVPHYDNSPYAYLPGAGFRYPNNDMQPAAFGDGQILNMPRGIVTSSYGDRFGAMLEFASRMSAALGKRINMIHLSVNDTTILPRTQVNTDGFAGTLGWWDHSLMSDWSPTKSNGLAARIQKMIQTIAPNALLAENSTDTLEILGIVMPMGEGDAASPAGRESYARSAADFIDFIRDKISDSALSPYDTAAKVPVVHPLITPDPWEESPYDEDRLVNSAISEIVAADGFSASITPDNTEATQLFLDSEHFNGVGEGLNGNLIAIAMGGIVNDALAYGSPIVELVTDHRINICNEALSHIGESTIASLTEGSTEANLCLRFYERARDTLLESRPWSFAIKRVALTPSITAPPSSWTNAYVYPGDVMRIISILPDGATDDYSSKWAPGITPWDDYYWTPVTGTYTPANCSIETGPAGYRLIYTNWPDAQLRYIARQPDASRYPWEFRMALGYRLASLLAGPVLKGERGMIVARQMEGMADHWAGKASESDSRQRTRRPSHNVPWISSR